MGFPSMPGKSVSFHLSPINGVSIVFSADLETLSVSRIKKKLFSFFFLLIEIKELFIL